MSERREHVQEVLRSARSERIKAKAPRYLALALILILCAAGLRSIVSPANTAAEADAAGAGVVDQAAEDLALRFARTYLTYDVARPDARERALAAILPGSVDADGGLIPLSGSQDVDWLQVAQHQPAEAGGVVIVIAAQASDAPAPIYLAVPIDRRPSGALQILGYPALVGPPSVSTTSVNEGEAVEEDEVTEVASRVVSNYLRGSQENLEADLATDATFSLPTVQLRVRSVESVLWATTPENPAVLATVEAVDGARTSWTLTYEIGIDQSGDRTTATYIQTVPNAT